MKRRITLTKEEYDAFISWHEARLIQCQYPLSVVKELRRSRTIFLGSYIGEL